jgi:pyruvate-formate lyase-activating enzyme
MLLSGFEEENFTNYHKPSMTVGFPSCDFKCGKWCQNISLKNSKRILMNDDEIARRYVKNHITHAIVCAGLEPLDTFDMLMHLMMTLRKYTNDDIIIYTGYREDEVPDKTKQLATIPNVIIKYGRYVPDGTPTFDDVLGVQLASDNQYAIRIS